jgi:DNA-binding CsgD family transcriptional regulator
MVRMGLLYLALARALAGRADAAVAMQEIDDLGLPSTYLTGVDASWVRAWTTASAGELWTARAQLDDAAREGTGIGDHVGAAFALHSLARLGDPAAALPRLETLADLIEGELITARVAHVSALLSGRAADLIEVSERFEGMGADLLAAEAAADAAIAWRRAGDPHRAAAARWRTEVLVQTCEGAATPALKGLDVRASLTPAQREVALLAAAGRSNRDIADQLTLSVRTVENHLQQVYRKLGLHREELAARLGSPA